MSWKTPLIEATNTTAILTVIDIADTRPDIARQIIYQIDLTDAKQWNEWQGFLENEKSFRYIYTDEKQGFKFSFSGRKEYRRNWGPHGKRYEPKPRWFAHKYVQKQLRRKYLGAPKNMTVKKLYEVARELAQGKLVR